MMMRLTSAMTLAVFVLTILCTYATADQTHPRSRHSLLRHHHHVALSSDHQAFLHARDLEERNDNKANKNKTILSSWDEAEDVVDYVVVGGGTAGLAVARRLSDDPNVRVLVIEAGHTGAAEEKQIRTPNSIDYDKLQGGDLDWRYQTAKQENLNNRQLDFPAFRVIGGTSAGNDLLYIRQGRREAEALALLTKKMGGADSWSWDKVDAAMNASVDYQALDKPHWSTSSAIAAATIQDHGPVALSYPQASLAVDEIWSPALEEVKLPHARTPWQGDQIGGYIAPLTIEKASGLRCSSRTAYLDAVCDKRPNLQVLPDQTVTRILFDDKLDDKGKLRALGVEYAASKRAPRALVTAKREVIVSAGVVGSPQLLQLSGIGPKPVLKQCGIGVKKELAGVGQHLQDSLLVSLQFNVKAGVKLPSNKTSTRYVDSALAALSLKDVLGDNETMASFLKRADQMSTKYFNHNETSDQPVKFACLKTSAIQLHELLPDKSPAGLEGQPKAAVLIHMKTANGLVTFTVSLQSPLSRGNVNLVSNDAFSSPEINPAYLSHPADEELLISGIEWARKLAGTKTFKKFLANETAATASLRTRDAWAKWLREGDPSPEAPAKLKPITPLRAGYQASSTNSLLAEGDGGVVGPDLRVHGCSNVRVVDASVLPLAPSSALQAYVYGVAELAAGMIKADLKAGKAEPVEECQYGEEDDEHDESHGSKVSASVGVKVGPPTVQEPAKTTTEAYNSLQKQPLDVYGHEMVAGHVNGPAKTVQQPAKPAPSTEEEEDDLENCEEDKGEEDEAKQKKEAQEAAEAAKKKKKQKDAAEQAAKKKKQAEEGAAKKQGTAQQQQESQEEEEDGCVELDEEDEGEEEEEAQQSKGKESAGHHDDQHHEHHGQHQQRGAEARSASIQLP